MLVPLGPELVPGDNSGCLEGPLGFDCVSAGTGTWLLITFGFTPGNFWSPTSLTSVVHRHGELVIAYIVYEIQAALPSTSSTSDVHLGIASECKPSLEIRAVRLVPS